MTFDEILDQAIEMLRRRGRVSYSALKRQFDLDDDYLADLKVEIVEVHRLAVDQEGKLLVWTGGAASVPVPAPPSPALDRAPLAYTPQHLTDKILASRSALEGNASRSPCCLPTSKTRPS